MLFFRNSRDQRGSRKASSLHCTLPHAQPMHAWHQRQILKDQKNSAINLMMKKNFKDLLKTYSWDEHIELRVPLTRARVHTIGNQSSNICIQLDAPRIRYAHDVRVSNVEILDYRTECNFNKKKWLIIMSEWLFKFYNMYMWLFAWHWDSIIDLSLTHLTLAGQLTNSFLNCQISWRIVSINFNSAVGACRLRVTQSDEILNVTFKMSIFTYQITYLLSARRWVKQAAHIKWPMTHYSDFSWCFKEKMRRKKIV